MKKLLYSSAASLALLATSASIALADTVDPNLINVPNPRNYPSVGIGNVISAVLGILLVVAAIAALLYLILGGIQWITSGGDKQGLEGARNKITAAIVGLIIVASAWAIMLILGNFVGVNFLGQNTLTLPTIQNPRQP